MFEYIEMFTDLLYLLDLEYLFTAKLLDTWIKES